MDTSNKNFYDDISILQIEAEEKLKNINDKDKTELKDIIESNNKFKEGKSLDYHTIQIYILAEQLKFSKK